MSIGTTVVTKENCRASMYCYPHPAYRAHPLSEPSERIVISVDFSGPVPRGQFHRDCDYEFTGFDEYEKLLLHLKRGGWQVVDSGGSASV